MRDLSNQKTLQHKGSGFFLRTCMISVLTTVPNANLPIYPYIMATLLTNNATMEIE